jgi:hypothetical protein
MKDGTQEELSKQTKEFTERCKTLPEYSCYRTEEWLKQNATYSPYKEK